MHLPAQKIQTRIAGKISSAKQISRSIYDEKESKISVSLPNVSKTFITLVLLSAPVVLSENTTPVSYLENLSSSSSCSTEDFHKILYNLVRHQMNKSGRLQVYIHTISNTIIEVSPLYSVPESFLQWKQEFAEVLKNGSVRATTNMNRKPALLLKAVKGPVEKYFVYPGHRIEVSLKSGEPESIQNIFDAAKNIGSSPIFVINCDQQERTEPSAPYVTLVKKWKNDNILIGDVIEEIIENSLDYLNLNEELDSEKEIN